MRKFLLPHDDFSFDTLYVKLYGICVVKGVIPFHNASYRLGIIYNWPGSVYNKLRRFKYVILYIGTHIIHSIYVYTYNKWSVYNAVFVEWIYLKIAVGLNFRHKVRSILIIYRPHTTTVCKSSPYICVHVCMYMYICVFVLWNSFNWLEFVFLFWPNVKPLKFMYSAAVELTF